MPCKAYAKATFVNIPKLTILLDPLSSQEHLSRERITSGKIDEDLSFSKQLKASSARPHLACPKR